MANLDNPIGFYGISTINSGGSPQLLPGLVESGSNPITIGDPVVSSGGYVKIATPTDINILGVSNTEVPASTTENQPIEFWPANNTIFRGQCSGTLTQAKMWTTCDIEGSTGIFEVNEDATSLNVVQIIRLDPADDNVMGAHAKVWFMFKKAELAQDTAEAQN